MTGANTSQGPNAKQEPVTTGRWRPALPELVIAAIAVAVAVAAAAAVSGWPGVVTVAVAVVMIALLLLRGLIPRSADQAFRLARNRQQARSIHGYAQRRFVVNTSYGSRAMYESDLRPALEHVLAARLAERHAVNLYTDPDAAKLEFCRTRADESLWPWIDPKQALDASERARRKKGIPRRTLSRLITRLEQL
ncbi:hypothetical protein EAS64_34025 [Trebonia kvetii]|uniref:Uncharacterized protein n=1 Tax=Trebonia kvetii TaxID=2480626 RepID=A0A6P2BR03_9ACTN|nr:hypothetical protein [Trebonia kvetii]TVZ01298.1 hypothetical protein EAS64_34025 [Trebonia kvetii]